MTPNGKAPAMPRARKRQEPTMQPNNSDIQRDLGRLEANQAAAKELLKDNQNSTRERFSQIEQLIKDGFNTMNLRFSTIEHDLRGLEGKESNRSTVERFSVVVMGFVAAVVGWAASLVTGHFWK